MPSTLLVFTLGPAAEVRRRHLLPRSLAPLETVLVRRCLDEAIEAGSRLGLRVVVSCPVPIALPEGVELLAQSGRSFAERLAGAVSQITDDGPLLVVGTDTPGLSPELLDHALGSIVDHDGAVVGPSPDGGIYLLGARHLSSEMLASVAWCSPAAGRTLLAALRRSGRRAHILPSLVDLDDRTALFRWIRLRPDRFGDWIAVALRALREIAIRSLPPLLPTPALLPAEVARGRAPP